MAYKTELQGNNTDLQAILSKVNALPDQLVLPALTNPAGAANIEAGYQAINGAGEVVVGAMPKKVIETTCIIDGANITIGGYKMGMVGIGKFTFGDTSISPKHGDYFYLGIGFGCVIDAANGVMMCNTTSTTRDIYYTETTAKYFVM